MIFTFYNNNASITRKKGRKWITIITRVTNNLLVLNFGMKFEH